MNNARIEQLDICYTVWREYVDYAVKLSEQGKVSVSFPVWLYDQYKKARVGK